MRAVCFELRARGGHLSVSGSEGPPLQEQSGLLQDGEGGGERAETQVSPDHTVFFFLFSFFFTLGYVKCS